jgi:Flp pilus assembly protein TadB
MDKTTPAGGNLMVTFFLFLSVLSFGWFVHGVVSAALSALERRRQAIRIGQMIHGSRSPLPLQDLLRFVKEWPRLMGKTGPFERYIAYLEDLLRRASHPGLSASDVLGYQVFFAIGFSIFWEIMSGSLALTIVTFLLGPVLPILWLRDKALLREKRILRELPNALEVLALCSEAGLSVEQGMEQYLLNGAPGPLRDELSRVLEQTRVGSSRKEALLASAQKLGLDDFTFFTTSLVQAERFGTGVAKTLRQLSMTIRDKQAQRAERSVQELPVKLLFPLILFIMPVTFIVIFGPIVLRLIQP